MSTRRQSTRLRGGKIADPEKKESVAEVVAEKAPSPHRKRIEARMAAIRAKKQTDAAAQNSYVESGEIDIESKSIIDDNVESSVLTDDSPTSHIEFDNSTNISTKNKSLPIATDSVIVDASNKVEIDIPNDIKANEDADTEDEIAKLNTEIAALEATTAEEERLKALEQQGIVKKESGHDLDMTVIDDDEGNNGKSNDTDADTQKETVLVKETECLLSSPHISSTGSHVTSSPSLPVHAMRMTESPPLPAQSKKTDVDISNTRSPSTNTNQNEDIVVTSSPPLPAQANKSATVDDIATSTTTNNVLDEVPIGASPGIQINPYERLTSSPPLPAQAAASTTTFHSLDELPVGGSSGCSMNIPEYPEGDTIHSATTHTASSDVNDVKDARPIDEKINDKNWKTRSGAYMEIKEMLSACQGSEKNVLISSYLEFLPKMCGDINASALDIGLETGCLIMDHSTSVHTQQLTEYSHNICKIVIDKSFAARSTTQQRGKDVILKLIECTDASSLCSYMLTRLNDKKQKIPPMVLETVRYVLLLFVIPSIDRIIKGFYVQFIRMG